MDAPWRSDSDMQVSRYPPAARVFQSLIMAGLNARYQRCFQNEPGFQLYCLLLFHKGSISSMDGAPGKAFAFLQVVFITFVPYLHYQCH